MNLAIIVAMDQNGLIGSHNGMPWEIKEDLAYFKRKTLAHSVVMGKNTWLSIGKPLPERTNIILSRSMQTSPPGTVVCSSIAEVLEIVQTDLCFIIGGAQVFQSFLPLVDRLFITKIDAVFRGDTYFPGIDYADWDLQFYEQMSTESGYNISFNEYKKKPPMY